MADCDKQELAKRLIENQEARKKALHDLNKAQEACSQLDQERIQLCANILIGTGETGVAFVVGGSVVTASRTYGVRVTPLTNC